MTFFEIPILKREFVGGSGPRVELQMRAAERGGAFEDEARDRGDRAMAKQVGDYLHTHYRGHFWKVHVDSRQGVCLISIPILMSEVWHYKIPLTKLDKPAVVHAGGEILERLNIPRSGLDVASFVEARGKKAYSRGSRTAPTG